MPFAPMLSADICKSDLQDAVEKKTIWAVRWAIRWAVKWAVYIFHASEKRTYSEFRFLLIQLKASRLCVGKVVNINQVHTSTIIVALWLVLVTI